MARTSSLLRRTDWSDLPKIIAAALAIGGSVSLILKVIV